MERGIRTIVIEDKKRDDAKLELWLTEDETTEVILAGEIIFSADTENLEKLFEDYLKMVKGK